MDDNYRQLGDLVQAVEQELHRLECWESQAPSPQALASSQPFAIDRLNFTQWLQFIFLPKLTELVEAGSALPQSCSTAPMAEEYFKTQQIDAQALINHLAAIDRLITDF